MSAVLAVCGCDGNDGRESSGPRIEPALLGSLTIDADGGTDTVSYSIINPVEGGKVSASASESWISGLDCSTENAVIITSDPNPETVRRSCVITLTYSYSEGGKAAMTFTPEYSMGVSTTMDEQVIFDTGFEEGSLEISYADGVMTLEAFLTDTDGKTHHVTYTGKAEYQIDNGGGNEPPLEEDLHIDGTCTFEFSFLDDKGNTWDGKWTGTLSVRSSSGIKQMKLF